MFPYIDIYVYRESTGFTGATTCGKESRYAIDVDGLSTRYECTSL